MTTLGHIFAIVLRVELTGIWQILGDCLGIDTFATIDIFLLLLFTHILGCLFLIILHIFIILFLLFFLLFSLDILHVDAIETWAE